MKAIIQWSERQVLELNTEDAKYIFEDLLFDVPEELVQEYQELTKKNKEMQEKLKAIYGSR